MGRLAIVPTACWVHGHQQPCTEWMTGVPQATVMLHVSVVPAHAGLLGSGVRRWGVRVRCKRGPNVSVEQEQEQVS